MNIDELRELLQILDERGVGEFELEEGGRKLRIRKSLGSSAGAPAAQAVSGNPTGPSVHALAPSAALETPSEPMAAAGTTPTGAEEAGLVQITSPIVGTFYRSPDPNSPPFVKIGDQVRVGQVLCIVEAMKLMNEIEAESAGEIVKIHAQNGQPVQYGDPLFTLRPLG